MCGCGVKVQYVSIKNKNILLMIVEQSLDGASGSVLFQTDGVKMETEWNEGTEQKAVCKTAH